MRRNLPFAMKTSFLFESSITAAFFAVMYFLLYQVQVHVLTDFDFLPMASILFLPAGVKFIAMVVGQAAGVMGIAIGMQLVERHQGMPFDVLTAIPHLLVWLLLPYALLRAYLVKNHLTHDLSALTTYQLVVLASVASIVSSLGTQLYFFGIHDPQYPLLRGMWSMTVGDVSGIAVSLGFIVVVRRVFIKRERISS